LWIEDQTLSVGERLQLGITATDSDGDPVSFEVSGLPPEAELAPVAIASSLLVWSPKVTDTNPGGRQYETTIRARDGRGGGVEQSFTVTVLPAYGVPVIELPVGLTLDLAQESYLTLDVVVRDDDSEVVELGLTEAPVGAQFLKTGPKSGLLHWKPEGSQLIDLVHPFTVFASDGSNPPVTHTLMVVLLGGSDDVGCPGTAPTVIHTPLADQELIDVVRVEAQILDQESQVQGVALHWTSGDPAMGVFNTTAFSPVAEDEGGFEAFFDPGPLESEGRLIHYSIEVTDNDDPTSEACDHGAVSPKVGFHVVGLYPEQAGGLACIDDQHEPDDLIEGAPMNSSGSYSGRMCGAQDDVFGVGLEAGETLSAVLSHAPEHGELTLELLNDQGQQLDQASANQGQLLVHHMAISTESLYVRVRSVDPEVRLSYQLELLTQLTHCEPDVLEPNDGPEVSSPLEPGVTQGLEICPGDLDWFRVDVPEASLVTVTMRSEPGFGDLDLSLTDLDGGLVLATSMTYDPTETLVWTSPGSEQLLVLVYGHQGGVNAYELEVSVTPLENLCLEDLFGVHDTHNQSLPLFSHVVYSELVACAASPDWFAVDVNGGETLEVTVYGVGSSAAPSVSIVPEGSDVPVASSASIGGAQVASWATSVAGQFHLVVESAVSASYELVYSVNDPPGACLPDRFEPNDSTAEATIIEPGVFTWLRLCPEDPVDAFTIDMKPFEHLMVMTSHQEGIGFTDVEVIDPSGAILETAFDPSQGAYLEATALEEGPLVVRVLPYSVSSTLGYDLAIWVD